MSAAPLVGSIEIWKKSSRVRFRIGMLRLQARPSMQIGPLWMTWSEACDTAQLLHPSMVWAMYTFQMLLGLSWGFGCAPVPPLAPYQTTSTAPSVPAAIQGMTAVLFAAGYPLAAVSIWMGAVAGFQWVPSTSDFSKMWLPSAQA